jgi:chromosome segregation ATPase
MARPASVTDVEIFKTVNTLAIATGQRPTPYAIRQALSGRSPTFTAPSYGLIRNALERLDALLATGYSLDKLIGNAEASIDTISATDDAGERLTNYLTTLVRPIAEQLISETHARAEAQDTALTAQLDAAYQERDEVTGHLQVATEQLQTSLHELHMLKDSYGLVSAERDTHGATINALRDEVAHLKSVMDRDRDALERHRTDSAELLKKAQEAATNREREFNQVLLQRDQTITELHGRIAELTGKAASLNEQLSATARTQDALNEQLAQQRRDVTALRAENATQRADLEEQTKNLASLENGNRALYASETQWRTEAEHRGAALQTTLAELATLRQNEPALLAKVDSLKRELELSENRLEKQDLHLTNILARLIAQPSHDAPERSAP